MKLFSIQCLTCQARLAVRDTAALGQILACPKCGSMVEVRAPAGWTPPQPPANTATPAESAAPNASPAKAALVRPAAVRPKSRPAANAMAAGVGGLLAVCDAGIDLESPAIPATLGWWSRTWARPVARWTAIGGGSTAAALLSGAMLWGLISREPPALPVVDPAPQAPAAPLELDVVASSDDHVPDDHVANDSPAPLPIDSRWMPDHAASIVSLRWSAIVGQRDSGQRDLATAWINEWRANLIEPLCQTLRIDTGAIGRITWAGPEPEAGAHQALVVVALDEPLRDDATLLFDCQPQAFDVGGAVCYRREGPWPHAFAVVDEHTIVTGPDDLLQAVALRQGDPELAPAIEQLLDATDPAEALTILLDMASADPAPPGDEAPSGMEATDAAWLATAWPLVQQHCDGLGVAVTGLAPAAGELRLVCASESAADRLHATLRKSFDQLNASSRENSTDAAPSPLLAALARGASGVNGAIVWFRAAGNEIGSPDDAADWLAAASDALGISWTAAAEERQQPSDSEDALQGIPDENAPADAAAVARSTPPGDELSEEDRASEGYAEPAPPPPVPPRVVNAAARMADPLPRLACRGMSLASYVQLLSDLSGVSITLDMDALAAAGVSVHDPLSIELTDSTMGDALLAAVAPAGLGWRIDGSQVVVTAPSSQRASLTLTRHELLPWASADEGRDLADWITAMVDPTSWTTVGGQGTVEVDGNALSVRNSADVQRRVAFFLEQIRQRRANARGAADGAASPRPAPEWAGTKVTANFQSGVSLRRLGDFLDERGGPVIVVDWVALRGQGIFAPAIVSGVVDDIPMATFLEQLLAPGNLDYRVIDARTLQITSREATLARPEVDFLATGELTADDPRGEALLDRLRTALPQAGWDTPHGAAARFDRASGALIVRGPRETLAKVRALLDKWRSG